MRQHQGHDLAECQRERSVFATIFSRPLKDQSGAWHNGASFGLIHLEVPMNVVSQAKEWMTTHMLKYWSASEGSTPAFLFLLRNDRPVIVRQAVLDLASKLS